MSISSPPGLGGGAEGQPYQALRHGAHGYGIFYFSKFVILFISFKYLDIPT
jgi:hypothetical protein